MHLYVYDCVINWDVHVGYSGSRCCAQNFGTAGCPNNGPSEHCLGTVASTPVVCLFVPYPSNYPSNYRLLQSIYQMVRVKKKSRRTEDNINQTTVECMA